MGLVSISDLLNNARSGKYGICGFDCWNLESISGILIAASELKSPVLICIEPEELYHIGPNHFFGLINTVTANLNIPISFQLNEISGINEVLIGIKCGFNSVMIENTFDNISDYKKLVKKAVELCSYAGLEVEAEVGHLKNAKNNNDSHYIETNLEEAKEFVMQTGIKALSVSVGNIHELSGEEESIRIDFELLSNIVREIDLPIVLHGGSGMTKQTIRKCIKNGVSMIKVGTVLKRVYFENLKILYNKEQSWYMSSLIKLLDSSQNILCQKAKSYIELFGSKNKAFL